MSVHLTILSNVSEFPYEKTFPLTITLNDFKQRLELIIGVPTSDIKLELKDKNNQVIKNLTDDNATLDELGIKSEHIIYAESKNVDTGLTTSGETGDRYVMDDHKYEQLSDSLRNFKKKIVQETNPTIPEHIKIGQKCMIRLPDSSEKIGTVSYIGETHFKPGIWVGIIYDQPIGKNDGSIEGKRYFTAPTNCGSFVKPTNVYPIEEIHKTNDDFEEI